MDGIVLDKLNKILKDKNLSAEYGTLDASAEFLYKRFGSNKVVNLQTPCYIIDKKKLINNFNEALNVFSKNLSNNYKPFYPVKINNHIFFAETAVKCGYGLEVASISELNMALKVGAERILYYAPGKKYVELEHILSLGKNIQIHIDSFTDLKMIGKISSLREEKINIGVRIYFDFYGAWNKYGINIEKLRNFFNEVKQYPNLKLNGIHFHTSRNKTPDIYKNSIKRLGIYLKEHFSSREIQSIEYIDFGGGLEKDGIEGFYEKNTKYGYLNALLFNEQQYEDKYKTLILKASTINEFAKDISQAINQYINVLFNNKIDIYSEIGRYIVADTMHILSKVVDVKSSSNNMVIMDSGVNLVGWQRGDFEYYPIINLSNYGGLGKQLKVVIYGNLCTTRDLRGYWCYSKSNLQIGDILLFGNQGALTYSLAQNFINPIAKIHIV